MMLIRSSLTESSHYAFLLRDFVLDIWIFKPSCAHIWHHDISLMFKHNTSITYDISLMCKHNTSITYDISLMCHNPSRRHVQPPRLTHPTLTSLQVFTYSSSLSPSSSLNSIDTKIYRENIMKSRLLNNVENKNEKKIYLQTQHRAEWNYSIKYDK